MGDRTKISWCDSSWNPLRGCSRISAGCENCYAEKQAGRFSGPGGAYEGLTRKTSKGVRWTGQIMEVPHKLDEPIRWRKPRRIFVDSMSDLFHKNVSDEYIDRVFAVMALSPQHTFQVLTKRPERMRDYMLGLSELGRWGRWLKSCAQIRPDGELFGWPLPHVQLGVSIEDQPAADERIPLLLATPAAVRFVSAEPLLGELNLRSFFAHSIRCEFGGHSMGHDPCHCPRLHWVIVGGESGPGARPCLVESIRDIRDQCVAAKVPLFIKQTGSIPVIREARDHHDELAIFGEWPDGARFGNPTGDKALSGRVANLKHPAGADPTEWPEDLRVQQYPTEETP